MSDFQTFLDALQPFADGTAASAATYGDCVNYPAPAGTHHKAPDVEAVEAGWDFVDCNSSGIRSYHHDQIKALGCRVRPGERDSFGWVTAVLQTPHGWFLF